MIKRINNSYIDNKKLSEININIDDQLENFDFSKVVVKKPWGYEYLAYQEEGVSIWILHIKKDALTSMHSHLNKKTDLIILSGNVVCSTLEENFELKEGDIIILDKRVFHSTKALTENVLVMEIEFPSKKTDLVRLNDVYGRQSEGYEKQKEMCFDLSQYERIFLDGSDLNRKIGNMNLSIENINIPSELMKYLKSNDNMLNIFISGELDSKNSKGISVGDPISYSQFEKGEPEIKKMLKILSIKKNILDFD